MSEFKKHCWHDVIDSDTREIYQPYERVTFIGKKPALLLIDLYNLVYEGGSLPVKVVVKNHPSSCGVHAWDAVEPTKQLISLARCRDIPLIYSTQVTNHLEATNRVRNVVLDNSYDIHEAFRPEPDDLIIRKERASCFFGTPLIAYLTKMGIDSLIICGESTSGCVRATAVDAHSYGFHSVIAEECTFDRSLISHKVSLFDLHHKYADVMSLDEVKAHLDLRMVEF
ncbi:isochorismatase family protein [Fictibacillus terranigra]|uniref:Isochorismatase family protein n=1 Tax=Fictibacillus terranigra TaxID=3058424 RepID=A0ABT8EC68_9BACL|nr:isochorismatase family protein [Fictibacillus sp. CENA-BCM004]MDN4075427.1 isochorismatase family protein [Fictibacillus sp. CENA-BCM004]